MARRNQSLGTKAGLRGVQKLGTLAVPGSLEKVPEENEAKPEVLKPEIFGTDDWRSVENAVKEIFRKEFLLSEPGKIYKLHQNVKNILRSRTGTFLSDCYKEWLTKELNFKAGKIKHHRGSQLLHALEDIWTPFYNDILPLLEAVLILLKPKGRLSVRTITLATFRDTVVFSEEIEDAINRTREQITPEIQQCILILQNVNDSYPPCKNRLRLESVAAKICSPFMGYFGLYEEGELVITSNEPSAFTKRRPSEVGPRRISRPFSIQPQQMDTLNQLFKKAVHQRAPKVEYVKRSIK